MSSSLAARARARAGAATLVTSSYIAVALSSYLVLVLAGHSLSPTTFAAISSFYLLTNTVGRGIFAAVELELTRAIASARAAGLSDRAVGRSALWPTALLAVVALGLVAICSPLLLKIFDGSLVSVLLLAGSALAMSAAFFVRGVLAGRRRYKLYAGTFWIEAFVAAALAAALALAHVSNIMAWTSVFVCAPFVAAFAFWLTGSRESPMESSTETTGGVSADVGRLTSTSELLWSSALLVASQGVWNLAPVILAARLTEEPTVAAGFVAVAVILRAPVLLVPAAQAFVLPVVSATLTRNDYGRLEHAALRLLTPLGLVTPLWLLAAAVTAPILVRLFGVSQAPSTLVVLALAASTIFGVLAQALQTVLVSARRQHSAAISWICGLVVLISVATLGAPALEAAAAGQIIAAIIVAAVMLLAYRRWRRTQVVRSQSRP